MGCFLAEDVAGLVVCQPRPWSFFSCGREVYFRSREPFEPTTERRTVCVFPAVSVALAKIWPEVVDSPSLSYS